MNLKKLEAYGFKSFADKLTLEFNTGVTCIVGPNGCGKSNVSDAIRWVLGEQSPKNLRGKSMQEVIFNGTANRKALGYCEVSLYFDNTDRTYALDADEVIIKRKLFRSGDSEYYINNQTARLRDILDLFRDTGIGKDGYSVIGQGKIDGFLSAKPEDRRQIFEEAAGISKYKAKRIESQRKLDRTNDNLLRIKDKLDVYETRMAPLEKQSQEALRARELRERLKIAEVNHFIYLTEHNEEERSTVSQRLEKVTKSLTEAEREQAVLAEEYAYVQEKVHTSDDEYKRLTDEKLNLSIALSKKDGQNKLKAQELENTRKNLERLKAEVSEKNAAVSNHTASREANQKEQQQTILKIVENKKAEEDITEKLKEAETDVEKQRKEIDVTNEMLLSSADMWGQINGGLSKIKTEIALMEKNVEDYENSVDDKSRELKDVRKRLADTLAEYDRLTADRAEKKDIKLDIDKQYGQKFAANEDSVDRYNELRDTVAKLTSKVEYLEASKNSYGSYDAAVRFLMSRREDFIKDKILGVVGSAISTPAKFATAIEVALGGNINNMITADQKDTSFLIDFLNNNRGGRGTFMPLTAMRPRPLEDEYLEALEEDGCFGVAADLVKYDRRFRPAIETLLGRVVVVDTKDTAIEMSRRFRNAFRIVTLDGAHYAVNGTVSGGRKEGADSRIMSVEADLADAKRNLANNKQIMEVLAQDISEAKKELQKMEDTSSVLENIISKLDKELTVCEQKKEYMQREEERLNGEVERLKKLISDAKSEIAVNENLYSIESKKMDNTSGERVNTNDLLDKLAVSLRQKEEKRNAISAERIEIIASGKQLEEKLKKTSYLNMILSCYQSAIVAGKTDFDLCEFIFFDDVKNNTVSSTEVVPEIDFKNPDFVYSNDSFAIPIKNTVTGINSKQSEAQKFSTKAYLTPQVQYQVNEDKAIVGTHYHKALELLDLTQEYQQNTNFDDVDYQKIKMAHSKLSVLAKGAKSIHKETDFMMYLPYNDLVAESRVNEKVLVQGVLDMLIEFEDHFDIVDYKFSNLKADVLKQKYAEQLRLYKLAVENAYGKKVEHMYIYSINTGELI